MPKKFTYLRGQSRMASMLYQSGIQKLAKPGPPALAAAAVSS